MTVVAKLNYLRIAPRKVRLVADLIRGKSVEEAQTILNFTVKKGAKPIMKLLNQGLANAKSNFQLDPSDLYVAKITVDEGPKYKRWQPRARGRVSEIQKKTSHITVFLDSMSGKPKKIHPLKSRKARAAKPQFDRVRKTKPAKEVKPEAEEKTTKETKPEKPQFRPEKEMPKPKTAKGIKKVFRRKAF